MTEKPEIYVKTDITPDDLFVALAAALHPAWHQSVIVLAEATQEVSEKIDRLVESKGKDLRPRARELIESLVNYLDAAGGDADADGDDDLEQVGDDEPSLGSFDRMTDQTHAWRGGNYDPDAEVDDCDREDCDPDEAKQQPPEMGGAADPKASGRFMGPNVRRIPHAAAAVVWDALMKSSRAVPWQARLMIALEEQIFEQHELALGGMKQQQTECEA